jgi:hypothetical protein
MSPPTLDYPNVHLLLITHPWQTPQHPTTPMHDDNPTRGEKIALLLPVTFFAHVKNIKFDTKAEVAAWCQSNIIMILWHLNTISLMKTASTKACHLCAVECMIIGQNFYNAHQRTKMINLKSKIRGICNCKKRFQRFNQSD